jgi:hypothetical protein
MSDLINAISCVVRTEMEKPEWKQQVLEPITRWIFGSIWPYALGIILANFFMTIAAVSLVLYFTIMKSGKS